jgi:hypothetical protein
MSKGKLACLAAAIAIGAALIGAPALAQGAGGGMGWHGGGGMGWHGGGAGWHGAAWRGAPIRSAAINSGAWRGAAWRGAAWHGGWHGRFFPRRRFAFFHHRRFFGPFVGLYASGYGSCWSWVPTPAGWQYVWVCGSSDYGYY